MHGVQLNERNDCNTAYQNRNQKHRIYSLEVLPHTGYKQGHRHSNDHHRHDAEIVEDVLLHKFCIEWFVPSFFFVIFNQKKTEESKYLEQFLEFCIKLSGTHVVEVDVISRAFVVQGPLKGDGVNHTYSTNTKQLN